MSPSLRVARYSTLALVAVAIIAGGRVALRRAPVQRPVMTPAVAARIVAARGFADSLVGELRTARVEEVTSAAAIAGGYFERQRLGLGSPFRLVELASRDSMMPAAVRTSVAYALLARALDGVGYETHGAALDEIANGGALTAARHGALIDSVVASAPSPRVGELAVRLAYRLAAASASVPRRGSAVATHAAALSRDRVLAREDARALLDAASRAGIDPLALVVRWRAERRFAVERPVLERPSPVEERAALDAAEPLIALIDSLAAQPAPAAPDPTIERTVVFGEGAARRFAAAAAMRGAPPQSPVVVAVSAYRRAIEGGPGEPWLRAARTRFVERARNEETLAAEYALLSARDTTSSRPVALAALWSAVSMRGYAQEAAWLPGDGGPSVPELRDRYGLARVSFDAVVPTSWRPYYLRMLGTAIADVQRVLPALSVRGLGVHFGESPMRGAALAMHDPATRTIFLPLATGAGVIAHELAHDLDWQVARGRYNARGTYSTDRAVRKYQDRLATAVRELATAGGGDSLPGADQSRTPQRPTEVFARNVDWFVSAALAREGRINGYLSGVQDGLLTGYAAVATPESSREAGEAMVRALEEMTSLPPATRSWFVDAYGRRSELPSYELVRRVLEVPLRFSAVRGAREAEMDWLPPSSRAIPLTLAATGADRCAARDGGADAELTSTRARLVALAAEARARGIVRQRARWAALRPALPWTLRVVPGSAWDPTVADSTVWRLRDVILRQVAEAEAARGAWAVVHATPLGVGGGCGEP